MHLNSEVTMFEMTGTIAVSSPPSPNLDLGARAVKFQNAPKFGSNDVPRNDAYTHRISILSY